MPVEKITFLKMWDYSLVQEKKSLIILKAKSFQQKIQPQPESDFDRKK